MGFIRDLYNRTENKIAEQFITNKIDTFIKKIKKDEITKGCDVVGEMYGSALNRMIITGINVIEQHTPAVAKLVAQNRDTLQQMQTLAESLNTEENKLLIRQILHNVTTQITKEYDEFEDYLSDTAKVAVKSFAKGFDQPIEPQYFIFESDTSDEYIQVTPEHYQERQFSNHMKFSCHATTKSGFKTWEAHPNPNAEPIKGSTITTGPAIKSASDIKL